MRKIRWVGLCFAGLSLGTAMLLSPEILACGGTACQSIATPVIQVAERIVFVQNDDGTVSAIVQISYSGPSDRFTWVLPVPGTPDVGVSSSAILDRLQTKTAPTLIVQRPPGRQTPPGMSPPPPPPPPPPPSPSAPPPPPPITVLDSGSVGPYDFDTIAVNPATPDPIDAAVEWFAAEGYTVSSFGLETLRPYLTQGMNLIAFRLTKDRSSGDIRPIMLTYEASAPSIPIRPTAMAAADNMGIMVFVLGPHRAVPLNYRTLILNEAFLDWFGAGRNYVELVSSAADEAGGQGFVTEYARDVDFGPLVFSDAERSQWTRLRNTAATTQDHASFMRDVLRWYGAFDGVRETILEHIPIPKGRTAEELLNCVDCVYRGTQIPGFEPALFAESFERNVIAPMEQSRALIESRPYITRFFTTMSADEMTADPVFGFNDSLWPMGNVHIAQLSCDETQSTDGCYRVLQLPDANKLEEPFLASPPSISRRTMPSTAQVLQLSETGPGELIQDNRAEINAYISMINTSDDPQPAPAEPPPAPIDPIDPPKSSSCVCARATNAQRGLGLSLVWAFGLLTLGALRKR